MIFRTIIVFSVCAFLFAVSSKELRGRKVFSGKSFSPRVMKKSINTQNAVPSFPTNPTYATSYAYADATCTTMIYATSFLLDTCLQGPTSSGKYTCSGGIATLTEYSDTTCGVTNSTQTLAVGACSVDDGESSKITTCGTTANNFDAGDFVTHVTYQDSSCSSQVIESLAEIDGYCYTDSGASWMWSWPNITDYTTPDCTGAGVTSTPSNDCNANGATDDWAGNNAYQQAVYLSYTNFAPRSMHTGIAVVASIILAIFTLF